MLTHPISIAVSTVLLGMALASVARAQDVAALAAPAATSKATGDAVVDALTLESDFTVFLGPGVPAETHTRGLRQLWKLMPAGSLADAPTAH